MKQTVITLGIVFVIVGLLLAIILGSQGKKNNVAQAPTETNVATSQENQQLIFFYGNTCPHCKNVEEWIAENKIEEKITITKKEVYDNRTNSLELAEAARSCGLDTSNIGVPFLYTTGKKCLVGAPDITVYLSEIVKATQSAERSSK